MTQNTVGSAPANTDDHRVAQASVLLPELHAADLCLCILKPGFRPLSTRCPCSGLGAVPGRYGLSGGLEPAGIGVDRLGRVKRVQFGDLVPGQGEVGGGQVSGQLIGP
jgi:hypothetical protein